MLEVYHSAILLHSALNVLPLYDEETANLLISDKENFFWLEILTSN